MTVSVAGVTNGTGSSATNATSYTTGSISPTTGKPMLLGVLTVRVGGGTVPTVTGAGLTWTQKDTVTLSSYTVTLFEGIGTPSAGVLTISCGGVTNLNCHWHVVEVAGANTTSCVVQTAHNTGTSATASATLAAFANASNGTYAFSISNGVTDTWTPKASPAWTEVSGYDTRLSDTIGAHSSAETEWYAGNDTAPSASISGSSSWGMIAVELKDAGTTFTKSLTGSITATGALALATVIVKLFSGSITATGSLFKGPSKTLVGSVRPAGVLARLLNGVTGIDVPVEAAIDDGYWTASAFDNAGTGLAAGDATIFGLGVVNLFCRYLITIPMNAVINSATWEFPSATRTGTPTLKIAAGSVPDQAAPVNRTDIAGRTLTTAQVDWDGSSDGDITSPELKTILQEIVNAGSITSSLLLVLKDDGSPANNNLANSSFDALLGNVPILHVNYTAPVLWTALLTGSVTAVGSVVKLTSKALVGSSTPVGTIIKTVSKVLTGSCTSAGRLTKTTLKVVTGSIVIAGAIIKTAVKALTGSIHPTGILIKTTLKAAAGSCTAAGSIVKSCLKALTGSSTPAGSIVRVISKGLVGAITAVGSLFKLVSKVFTGSTTATGSLANSNAPTIIPPLMESEAIAHITLIPADGTARVQETDNNASGSSNVPPSGYSRLRWFQGNAQAIIRLVASGVARRHNGS